MTKAVRSEPGELGHVAVRAVLAAIALLLLTGACNRPTVSTPPASDNAATAALRETGPDWETIEKYMEERAAWIEDARKLAIAQNRHVIPFTELPERPDIGPAITAASAILQVAGDHDKTIEAAEFLIKLAQFDSDAAEDPKNEQLTYAAARTLIEQAPDYERWPQLLEEIDRRRPRATNRSSTQNSSNAFLEEIATEADNPVLRASVRYYRALDLARAVNASAISAEEREARRQRALDMAIGLKAGVEDEAFLGRFTNVSTPMTFAEVETVLVDMIRHATVGGTLPDLTGTRLDGVTESLADYKGRVVLVDFWATWCQPCIAALPELRGLVASLPADRFTILAISVDAEPEFVTDFLEKEAMPWANWHVGTFSDVTRKLDVRSFPTYLLVDQEGQLLARTNRLSEKLVSLIEQAVANVPPG